MTPLERFNPYDLNHVAEIEKWIQEERQKRLLEQSATKKAPKKGILKPLTKEERINIAKRGH